MQCSRHLFAESSAYVPNPCNTAVLPDSPVAFKRGGAYEQNKKTAGMAVSRHADTLYITGHAAAGNDRSYLCRTRRETGTHTYL